MVTVNGEKVEAVDKNLAEYLEEKAFDIKKIAVEINGEIVPKSKYSETVLHDGDSVEVVSFGEAAKMIPTKEEMFCLS